MSLTEFKYEYATFPPLIQQGNSLRIYVSFLLSNFLCTNTRKITSSLISTSKLELNEKTWFCDTDALKNHK
jgi:hypothetical protein